METAVGSRAFVNPAVHGEAAFVVATGVNPEWNAKAFPIMCHECVPMDSSPESQCPVCPLYHRRILYAPDLDLFYLCSSSISGTSMFFEANLLK